MRLRVGVCASTPNDARMVAERTFPGGADVTLGGDDACDLVVPDWEGPHVFLFSGDGFLHLAPGMRVNMCISGGGLRLVGTYEELAAIGTPLPIPILGRVMNVRLRNGFSVFAKHLRDDEE